MLNSCRYRRLTASSTADGEVATYMADRRAQREPEEKPAAGVKTRACPEAEKMLSTAFLLFFFFFLLLFEVEVEVEKKDKRKR